MSTPWKSQQIGYEDVPLAVDEIVRSEKESRLVGWVVMTVLTLANLVGISVMVVVAQWLMPSVNPLVTAVVATGAYVVGVIGMGIEKLDRRQTRMEVHALTLHDEVLYNQEKLDEIERRFGFKRI
jgi:predicted tellurium resistance membrane protein TerC